MHCNPFTKHTNLIHYMRIHSVPVHQLMNYFQLARVASQKEAVKIILYTERYDVTRLQVQYTVVCR